MYVQSGRRAREGGESGEDCLFPRQSAGLLVYHVLRRLARDAAAAAFCLDGQTDMHCGRARAAATGRNATGRMEEENGRVGWLVGEAVGRTDGRD